MENSQFPSTPPLLETKNLFMQLNSISYEVINFDDISNRIDLQTIKTSKSQVARADAQKGRTTEN
jgi:hypothetical protein